MFNIIVTILGNVIANTPTVWIQSTNVQTQLNTISQASLPCDYTITTVTVTQSIESAIENLLPSIMYETKTLTVTTNVNVCPSCASDDTVYVTGSSSCTATTVQYIGPSTCSCTTSVDNNTSCTTQKSFTSIASQVLQESLSQLVKELTVDKTTTSAYTRSKTCATDDRPSAATVGCFGILMLALPFVFILGLDLTGMIVKLKKFKSCCKTKTNMRSCN